MCRNGQYLRSRFPPGAFDRLRALIQSNGESVPTPPVIALRVADPKDDYLLAVAIAGNADYLVSGDKHLLVIKDRILRPSVVSPAEFARVLMTESER